jgi:hypothetical protein
MNRCPTREQLARVLAEQLAGSEAEPVEAHLESCRSCQEVLVTREKRR